MVIIPLKIYYLQLRVQPPEQLPAFCLTTFLDFLELRNSYTYTGVVSDHVMGRIYDLIKVNCACSGKRFKVITRKPSVRHANLSVSSCISSSEKQVEHI